MIQMAPIKVWYFGKLLVRHIDRGVSEDQETSRRQALTSKTHDVAGFPMGRLVPGELPKYRHQVAPSKLQFVIAA